MENEQWDVGCRGYVVEQVRNYNFDKSSSKMKRVH